MEFTDHFFYNLTHILSFTPVVYTCQKGMCLIISSYEPDLKGVLIYSNQLLGTSPHLSCSLLKKKEKKKKHFFIWDRYSKVLNLHQFHSHHIHSIINLCYAGTMEEKCDREWYKPPSLQLHATFLFLSHGIYPPHDWQWFTKIKTCMWKPHVAFVEVNYNIQGVALSLMAASEINENFHIVIWLEGSKTKETDMKQ